MQALGFVPQELCVEGSLFRPFLEEFGQVSTQSKHVLATARLLAAKMHLCPHFVYLRRDMRFKELGPALIR